MLLIIPFMAVISCSKDSNNETLIEVTCGDGIQNGDETGVDCGGSCGVFCIPDNALEGEVITRLVLNANSEHILTGPLLVRDGAILEIEAGTIIKAESNRNAYIAVAKGGKFYVWGKEDNPVIMTSNSDNPAPGDWGGIIICGNARNNKGTNARSDLVDIFYGGADSTFSSGVIQYLRLEYTGENYSASKKFNGITFYGVGSFTTAEYIQSYNSAGNGIEIVGGTMNAKNFISLKSGQNGLVIRGGWNGNGNSWFIANAGESGLVIENSLEDPMAMPITSTELNNISIVGPEMNGAILYTNGGGIVNLNEIYTSNIELGININSSFESTLVDEGNLNLNPILFDGTSSNFVRTNYNGSTQFYTEGNTVGAGNGALKPVWANNWTVGF